jgi:predicted aminopeptidase
MLDSIRAENFLAATATASGRRVKGVDVAIACAKAYSSLRGFAR